MDWTPEADAELEKLMLDGLSATQIGARIGCSRNAVIGRAHRRRKSLKVWFARKQPNKSRKVKAPVRRPAITPASAQVPIVTTPASVELPKPKMRVRRMNDIDLERLFREGPEPAQIEVIDAPGVARALGIRSYVKEIVMRSAIDQRWSDPRPMPVSLPFVSILGARI